MCFAHLQVLSESGADCQNQILVNVTKLYKLYKLIVLAFRFVVFSHMNLSFTPTNHSRPQS